MADAKKQDGAPFQLCFFKPSMTAAETFERTARYARDPAAYLIDTLGQEEFNSRKSSMIIPDKVDLDSYGKGSHKQNFEKKIAAHFGKTEGLFFLTGTQAQAATLKVHCERAGRDIVAWHHTAHLEIAEESAWKHLYRLDRILIGSKLDHLPTLEDIQAILDLPEASRPAVILLEIPNRPLGCQTYTFSELQSISAACKAANVALHCDGARIWEMEPFYAPHTLAELGSLFDSIYVSFYKALRGITGAMVMQNDMSFIQDLTIWQRRTGGNAYTLGYEIVDCERAFNEMAGSFASKREKMIRIVEKIPEATASFKNAVGRKIVTFMPEVPTCYEINTYFHGYTEQELLDARDKVQEKMNVRVFERTGTDKLPDKMFAEARAAALAACNKSDDKSTQECDAGAAVDRSNLTRFIGWRIAPEIEHLEDDIFVNAYVELCKELKSIDTRV